MAFRKSLHAPGNLGGPVAPNVGVVWSHAFPVSHHIISRLIGGLAPVNLFEVREGPLSADNESALVSDLQPVTHLLIRPGYYPRRVLERLPNLQHIAIHGAGHDQVDVGAASSLGIQVTNAPGGNAVAIAELAVALMVALVRDLLRVSTKVREGLWEEARYVGRELAGLRLGIFGVGEVGTRVATRAQAFSMDVVGFDPSYSKLQLAERGVSLLSPREVLATADILTLHVPLSNATRHMMNREAFTALKPGALLINLSRGPIVDESALLEALNIGRLGGAALDVREVEPPHASDLIRSHPRVISTPHIGGSTVEALDRIAATCAQEILASLRGEGPTHAVNRVAKAGTKAAE